MIVLSNNTEHLDIRNECNVWDDTNKETKKNFEGMVRVWRRSNMGLTLLKLAQSIQLWLKNFYIAEEALI